MRKRISEDVSLKILEISAQLAISVTHQTGSINQIDIDQRLRDFDKATDHLVKKLTDHTRENI